MTDAAPSPGDVDIDAVHRAAERLRGVARRTPLVELTPRLSVKAECLQVTGSFKFRGAYNAIAGELEAGVVPGVVTHSSGNHAQGVARAARLLGVPATAVMPNTAPEVKRRRALADGARIVDVGPTSDERVEVARALCAKEGLLLISSTEHLGVIAGQATVGLELVESLLAAPGVGDGLAASGGDGLEVLVPVGGGGLASGVGIAVKALLPRASVIGVEPELAADARDSLREGRVVQWPAAEVTRTVADGLRHTSVGPIAFSHLRRVLDRIVTVAEHDIEHAVAHLAWSGRLVAEPSGAVALAAGLAGGRGAEHTVCVVSGGNVDSGAYVRWLTQPVEDPPV